MIRAIFVLLLLTVVRSYELSIITPPVDGISSITDGVIYYTYPDTLHTDVVLDSFYVGIEDSNGMSDVAIYRIAVIPRDALDYYVVPNPLEVTGHTALEMDGAIISHLNIGAYPYRYGSAIVLESYRPLILHKCFGRIDIFDAVGNKVGDNIPMVYVMTSTGSYAGVGVWNASNLNDRIVGAGAYVAIISATVYYKYYYEGELVETHRQVRYKVMIGVKHI